MYVKVNFYQCTQYRSHPCVLFFVWIIEITYLKSKICYILAAGQWWPLIGSKEKHFSQNDYSDVTLPWSLSMGPCCLLGQVNLWSSPSFLVFTFPAFSVSPTASLVFQAEGPAGASRDLHPLLPQSHWVGPSSMLECKFRKREEKMWWAFTS